MIPKPPSRAAERKTRTAAKAKNKREVYAAVTARDRRRCRACRSTADPAALDLVRRGHHHHITFRSAGGKDTTDNLVLLCASCHADVHAHRLTLVGSGDGAIIASGTWGDYLAE